MTSPTSCTQAILSVAMCLLVSLAVCAAAEAGGGPRNVLVVRNLASETSRNITNYYVRARGIPQKNVCSITCSTEEYITKSDCDRDIVLPIRQFLQDPELAARIDFIVLTKGIPLGASGYPEVSGLLSLTSVLTCLTELDVTVNIMNPYGPGGPEVAFTHDRAFNGRHLYLVTRLDAYTENDVYAMIDGSVAATPGGSVALDRRIVSSPQAYVQANNRLTTANDVLVSRGIPTIFDDTSTFMGNLTELIGYYSWGSNDPYFSSNNYQNYYNGLALYRSNLFKSGSIADSYVSTSGRTFNPRILAPPEQTLIADLIQQGACGVGGYIAEPYTSNTHWPQLLFDRYTKGYNMAESFYAACPRIYWRTVVAGDPLMAPFATPPVVTIDDADTPLTGEDAPLSATAVDASGVSRVDFYFDGQFVGTATQQPFSVRLDTTSYTVGAHQVEAWAYEATSVATQGYGSATVHIENPVSNLGSIADAFPSPDGQGVLATRKVVSAGTSELGGGEFYVQDEGHRCGIRVLSAVDVEEGDLVSVLGPLVTESGEKSIQADSVEYIDHMLDPVIPPVLMPNKSLGGADVNTYTGGVTGGRGARNIGLLVRTPGKVTYVGSGADNFFYIDDGSRLQDGSGHVGVKIKFLRDDIVRPPLGARVIVTGVSSCEEVGERVISVLKIRRQSDILCID